MVSVLWIKLARDLRQARAQVLTIGLVVACGVAGLVAQFSTHESLRESRDAFYAQARFADGFASVRRAPTALRPALEALPGVSAVKLETARDTLLALDGVEQALTVRVVGWSPAQADELNRLALRSGRWPQPGSGIEAVINERFATVRGLVPGTRVRVLLNGRLQTVQVVGTVISPEYVYATRSGVPDDVGFGVMWIDADRMASAYDMQGAFNRLSIAIDPQADPATVLSALDERLRAYGATESIGRDRQVSAAIVDNELRQLRVLGTALPALFLAVAVFVLNGVMSRQVSIQRPQIATLKAVGYDDRRIAVHYLMFAMAITLTGAIGGGLVSAWLGQGMLGLYAEVFRFGSLHYRTSPGAVAVAFLAVVVAGGLGAVGAIRAVLRLEPARAMQAPTPPAYRRMMLERVLGRLWPGPRGAMIAREIGLRPWRAASTVLGLSAAIALQICGVFWGDTVDHIADRQFRQVQTGDVTLEFQQPRPLAVARDLLRLPGVLQAEVSRIEPVRVSLGSRSVDTQLSGHPTAPRLLRTVDASGVVVDPPQDGLLVSGLLARELGVRPGDSVALSFRWWHRREVHVPVVAIVDSLFGKQLTASLDTVSRLSGDGEGVNSAVVLLDASRSREFHAAVKSLPSVAAVSDKADAIRGFEATTAESLRLFTLVVTVFAVIMAVGITYNAARIALSERAWELASLRVLGMTRAEVAGLLLAELAVELVMALPLGCLMGWAFAHGLMALMESDLIDFPVVIAPPTYGGAIAVVVLSSLASAVIVRRRIDAMRLVEALKVRE